MAERRTIRVRDISPAGGLDAALARRRGRNDPRPSGPVEYFGDDTDTPLVEMLKSARPDLREPREGEYVHVSDVISKCVRKIALMRRMGVKAPQEQIHDGRGVTFAIGDALHDFVKKRITSGHPDKVWAHWTCRCKATEHTGLFSSRPTTVCGVCSKPVDVHNEIPFDHVEYKLRGTPDLLLLLPEYDAILPVELKSMAAEQWKGLQRPVPDHVVQVVLYWHILKACGYTVLDRCSILYINKEFSFKLPYKEFLVDPTKVDLSMYWEDLDALKAALAGGELPPRIMCGDDKAPEAKKCPVCVTCFNC